MNQKNLIILCAVFAALVGLIFLKQSMKPQIPVTEEVADIIESPISLGILHKIEIRLGDGAGEKSSVQMVKNEDHWVVESQYGVRANEQIIAPVIEKLDQLSGELRSSKKELLEDYGLTDAQAVHVELYRQNGNPVHLLIGSKTAGFQNNFVRLNQSDAVYAVGENLRITLGITGEEDDQSMDVAKWNDKRLTHLEAANVKGLQITDMEKGDLKAVVDVSRESVEDKKQWTSAIPYDFSLSASKIKNVVESFNNTYAREIVSPEEEGAFDNPGWNAVFTMEDGGQVKLVRGKKDSGGNNYYMKQEGVGYYYLVPVNTFNSRRDRQGEIFADNPLKADAKAITEIEVHNLDLKKEFAAVKSTETLVQEDETNGDDTPKEEVTWHAPDQSKIETSKVDDIINKIRAIKLEAALQPEVSVDDSMRIRLVRDGVAAEYIFTKDIILNTGKECRFLRMDGSPQSYCASKSQVVALQNALP